MDERIVYVCPHCATADALPGPVPRRVTCPHCGFLDLTPTAACVTGRDWPIARAPEPLLGCLSALGVGTTDRKRRLLYAAVARTQFAWCQAEWFLCAVELTEAWADRERPRRRPESFNRLFRTRGARTHSASRDAELLSLDAIAPSEPLPLGNFRDDTRAAFADAVRELFPNPFVPLDWRPEWRSSTALTLAQHIYEARDFAAMPILADALQDADCDSEQVLTHCRGVANHARGCWVLDAVLGRG